METLAVETTYAHKLPWAEVLLMPLGDLQLGQQGADEGSFRRWVEYGMKRKCYFLGMGDYIDFNRPGIRKQLRAVEQDDTLDLLLDQAAQDLIDRFLALVKGTEGKWLGVLRGHHWHRFADGTLSDMRIAAALKAPYLGTATVVVLRFPRISTRPKEIMSTCQVWAAHGMGSGRRLSAPLNTLDQQPAAWPSCQVFLMGHLPRQVCGVLNAIWVTSAGNQRPYKRVVACTGGFMQAYVQGQRVGGIPQGNYAEEKMLPPGSLGSLVVHLRPTHTERQDFVQVGVEIPPI